MTARTAGVTPRHLVLDMDKVQRQANILFWAEKMLDIDLKPGEPSVYVAFLVEVPGKPARPVEEIKAHGYTRLKVHLGPPSLEQRSGLWFRSNSEDASFYLPHYWAPEIWGVGFSTTLEGSFFEQAQFAGTYRPGLHGQHLTFFRGELRIQATCLDNALRARSIIDV